MANSLDTEDEREEELASLSAIWPELVRNGTSYEFTLDLSVASPTPIDIVFTDQCENDGRADSTATATGPPRSSFTRLPPIQLAFALPDGYPERAAPQVVVSTSPEWLPREHTHRLQLRLRELWEESCHSQVLFAYIDSIQSDIEGGFGADPELHVHPDLRVQLLDFQARTDKLEFNSNTYHCGVCLEPKKGVSCYKMGRCGHIFCKECLIDFYSTCIAEGDVNRVQCMESDCTYTSRSGKKVKPNIAPAELLQIPLDVDIVRRYAEMRRKKKIEADQSVSYCPRKWCQAPARSDKYPVLTDLSLMTEAEDSLVNNDVAPQLKTDDNLADRLRICEKCDFAFCRVCNMSWHGDLKRCKNRDATEISKEEQATIAYIRRHTSECPVCIAPVQKSMGCNHMTCFQCRTHFCYLCATWLPPNNPYLHFNMEGRPCFQRLWDLEEGDNGEGNVQFVGARAFELDALGFEDVVMPA